MRSSRVQRIFGLAAGTRQAHSSRIQVCLGADGRAHLLVRVGLASLSRADDTVIDVRILTVVDNNPRAGV